MAKHAHSFGEAHEMDIFYRKVADLDLSIRTKNLLRNAGINTLQELASYTKSDLMRFRNLERSSLIELEDLMLKNNLSFGIVETIKSDNTQTLENALKQIEKLEAENKELLSILKGLVSDVGNLTGEHDIEWQQAGYFESAKEVIQKHN